MIPLFPGFRISRSPPFDEGGGPGTRVGPPLAMVVAVPPWVFHNDAEVDPSLVCVLRLAVLLVPLEEQARFVSVIVINV